MWQTHSTLVGSIQTARPIGVSKDMTAIVASRPDAEGSSLWSRGRCRAAFESFHSSEIFTSLSQPEYELEVTQHIFRNPRKSGDTFSSAPSRLSTNAREFFQSGRTGTIALPVPRVLVYYRYIITRVLLHTHKDMIVKRLRTELTARFSFMCLKPDL